MLRACVRIPGKMKDDLRLVEFSYSNSYQSTIKMAPFEVPYGRKCKTRLCWSDLDEALIRHSKLIQETIESIRKIREHIWVSRVDKIEMSLTIIGQEVLVLKILEQNG